MRKGLWTAGLATIVVLALGLRLWGIEWGLPNALHAYSYHTDETVILMVSRPSFHSLNLFAGQFLPHFYNYGSLQLYLNNIAISIISAYGPAAHSALEYSRLLSTEYLAGRILTAFMGTGTVWALAALGRRIYSERAGLLAGLLLALAPLHLQHSHFMTVDVPATFWVVLAMLWCAIANTDERRLRSLVLAAVFVGFASATKYNCALTLLPVVVTCFSKASNRSKLPQAAEALLVCGVAGAAYLVGCPGTVLEPGQFMHDFHMEAVHVSSQQELWFQGTGIGWIYIIVRNLADGLGWPLLVASLAGMVFAARRRSFGDLILLSFALPYYLLVGAAVSRYARYEIPLIPMLALFAATILTGSQDAASDKRAPVRVALIALVGLWTLVSGVMLIMPMSQTDPRDRAADWIFQNVNSSAQVAMPTDPWFWSAPLDRFFCLPGVGQWQSSNYDSESSSRIVPNYATLPSPTPFDVSSLTNSEPAVVTMSEFEYFDRLRLKDPATIAYIAELRRNYAKPIVFRDTHWLGGRRQIGGFPCQDLPIDMLYTSPTVLVFKRLKLG